MKSCDHSETARRARGRPWGRPGGTPRHVVLKSRAKRLDEVETRKRFLKSGVLASDFRNACQKLSIAGLGCRRGLRPRSANEAGESHHMSLSQKSVTKWPNGCEGSGRADASNGSRHDLHFSHMTLDAKIATEGL